MKRLDIVDDRVHCTPTQHWWGLHFDGGDCCTCGRYLLSHDGLRWRITEARPYELADGGDRRGVGSDLRADSVSGASAWGADVPAPADGTNDASGSSQ